MEFVKLEGRPLKGKELELLKDFLKRNDLDYDQGIEYSVCLLDENYRIQATGSAEQNVLKCIAVDKRARGFGLSGSIISYLTQYEFENGRSHILIYTKPENREMFRDLGFYPVLMTDEVLFMENRKNGFEEFANRLISESPKEALKPDMVIGSIVANCNPFTYGHRYLIEQALTCCDYVHVLVLADNRSSFGADERFLMVREGLRDLPRAIVHQAADYVISAATFPTYFIKEKVRGERAGCRLDLELFGRCIAPALRITTRFVGTEPVCAVTSQYNEEMKKILPRHGISVMEIERMRSGGEAISASEVRKWYEKGDFVGMRDLVPETTLKYLEKKKKGQRPKG
ncbi:[citrate (pro-3S)-lyase] ligase [Lacrimispora celerecrescens]|uniref:[citrate (pro-3S)-lyase] ligase n=1 Tax=Lacrimispora celerecrescens TaxID=29354 RepID=UPI0016468B6F|nr:[citrate (pro-3S)-lyase] ligase [Lacrimispora celerecrescens]